MAATIELKILTNEKEVSASLSNIQQRLNQLTSKKYEIKIETNIDKVSDSVIKYINAQARLETAHARTLAAEAKLTTSQNNLAAARERTTQTANRLAAAEERTTQTENQLSAAQERTQQSANRLATSQERTTQEMLRNERQQRSLQNSTGLLSSAFKRLSSILISELRQSFNAALTEMKKVDTELITIQKTTKFTSEQMKEFADDAYQVAAKLGATASEYLNAAAEFAKAGYKEQSKNLGELSVVTAKVGNTTQSVANQFLLSVDAAYRYEGSIEKLTAVLDGANEIGNNYATSVEKIAQGLGKVSPIAAQAHVGIDELSAAIGTITAVTQRSGTEAATALRALFLNIIGDTKTEIEDGAKWTAGEIEGLRDLLRKYAGDLVEAADKTGKVINPMEAVRALYMAMKEGVLTEQELMAQISDIGGKLRSSQLLALVQNFDKYEQMLETYRDSAGGAAKEYAIYLDSWEAKTKQLSATWTDFVQRQLGTDKIKELLDKLIDIVAHLDDAIPLIKAIGTAIAALNLQRLLINLQQIGTRLVSLIKTGFGPLGVAIAAVVTVIGVMNTRLNNMASAARDQASASADAASKIRDEAEAMQELAAQYVLATEKSDEKADAANRMIEQLVAEGKAVDNLIEKYKSLTRQKLEEEVQAAKTAQTDAALAMQTAYFAESKKQVRLGDDPTRIGGGAKPMGVSATEMKVRKYLYNSSAIGHYENEDSIFWAADGNTVSGVIAYHQAIKTALQMMNEDIYALVEQGDEEAASAIKNGYLYEELTNYMEFMGDYAEAYESASDALKEAELDLSGLDEFYRKLAWLNSGFQSEDGLAAFLKIVEKSNDLSEKQKQNLTSLAIETYPKYAAALGLVAEATESTKESTAGFDELLDEMDKKNIRRQEDYDAWIEKVKESTDITEEQRKALLAAAEQAFPKYAEAALMAKAAISKFNEATKKGGSGEKDDSFKQYQNAYETVLKEAKKGRYGSNAFQYGIQALLDPQTIKDYEGNWDGLVSYMQKSLGGLYKNADSMGQGLLDKVIDKGKKVGKSLYEIKGEGDKLLASFDKKSGAFRITEDPEGIKELAGKMGMSAESLIAAGMALGAIDPNADLTGLGDALKTILGEYDEEDPLAVAGETLTTSGETLTTAGENLNTAADKLTQAALDLMDKHDGQYVPGEGGEGSYAEPPTARGIGTSTADSGDRIEGVDPVTGETHVISAKTAILSYSGTGYSLWEDRIGGKKSGVKPFIFDENGKVVLGSTSNLGTGTAAEPVPVDIVSYSNKDSSAYHNGFRGGIPIDDFNLSQYGTGSSTNVSSIVTGLLGMVLGGGVDLYSALKSGSKGESEPVPVEVTSFSNKDSAAYHNGERGGIPFADFNLSQYGSGASKNISAAAVSFLGTILGGGVNAFSIFGNGSSKAETTTEEPVPVEVVSNKESGAYHNGNRGGIPIGDFMASQYGTGGSSGNLVIDVLTALFSGGSAHGGSGDSGAKISVDATEAQETLTQTKDALDEINNTEAEATATVDAEGAKNGAAEANDAIAGIVKSVTTDVYVNVHVSGGGKYTHGGSGMESEGDGSLMFGGRASGDESFHGGPVLVNEQAGGWNPELIVANGRAFIANGGDPAVINLPQGARIFNADETRSIFNGGADLINFPAFGDGYTEFTIKNYKSPKTGKKSSGSSGSSGNVSSDSTSSMSDDDMLKKLNEYMEQILDAAHDALDDQLEAINAQIYALKYQTEAAEKASALEEARLELLQAEQNLLDANTERTVRYYNAATGQWEWMADQREVLRAQEELADAQKNLLEAEYDALATAWSELKDEIEKALKEEGGPIDINAVLAALGKSAASGSKSGVQALIKDIFGYTDDPRAYANFDGGGIANGLGWMPKGNAGSEAVLDSNITNAILNPVTNAAFQGFTDSLTSLFQLAGGGIGLPSSRYGGNVSNLYGGNTYIEGVKIGSDMMNRPLSEVLSTLNLYKNA